MAGSFSSKEWTAVSVSIFRGWATRMASEFTPEISGWAWRRSINWPLPVNSNWGSRFRGATTDNGCRTNTTRSSSTPNIGTTRSMCPGIPETTVTSWTRRPEVKFTTECSSRLTIAKTTRTTTLSGACPSIVPRSGSGGGGTTIVIISTWTVPRERAGWKYTWTVCQLGLMSKLLVCLWNSWHSDIRSSIFYYYY